MNTIQLKELTESYDQICKEKPSEEIVAIILNLHQSFQGVKYEELDMENQIIYAAKTMFVGDLMSVLIDRGSEKFPINVIADFDQVKTGVDRSFDNLDSEELQMMFSMLSQMALTWGAINILIYMSLRAMINRIALLLLEEII